MFLNSSNLVKQHVRWEMVSPQYSFRVSKSCHFPHCSPHRFSNNFNWNMLVERWLAPKCSFTRLSIWHFRHRPAGAEGSGGGWRGGFRHFQLSETMFIERWFLHRILSQCLLRVTFRMFLCKGFQTLLTEGYKMLAERWFPQRAAWQSGAHGTFFIVPAYDFKDSELSETGC